MSILSLVETCGSIGLAKIISIVKKVLNLVQLFGPILAIIGLVIILVKLMANPDNKKMKNAFKNWLIALLMVFFIPMIVNVVMLLFDDSFSLAACWNYAEGSDSNQDSSYIDPDNGNNQSIIGDPSQYEGGEDKKDSNNGSVSNLIFIGDSRTIGMKAAVNSNDTFSAQGSMGLDWMQLTGVPSVEGKITSGSGIIILMGVNDLYQPDNYVSYINNKASQWTSKGAKVYFVSVMPTSGSYETLNTEIDAFNSKLKANLNSSVKYIDANSYLKNNGFNTTDGLHYTNETYQKIYNFIKANV